MLKVTLYYAYHPLTTTDRKGKFEGLLIQVAILTEIADFQGETGH